ncbi:hypothetical protein [Ottowia sp.]|uniref:hypothetical protein n=1 Tax=Ottowia sp. TaxID=1898956 RepID=UPI003A83B9D6
MTVDLQARAKLAESTRWLVGGRVTNYDFDDSIPTSVDPAIHEIYRHFLWLLYSDFPEYPLMGKNRLLQANRDMAARCVVFLKSGMAYPWPVLSRVQSMLLTVGNLLTLGMAGRVYARGIAAHGDMNHWPFLSQSQYQMALAAPVYLTGTGVGHSLQES